MKKILGRVILIILLILSITGIFSMTINNHVVQSGKDNIICQDTERDSGIEQSARDDLTKFKGDCILVLGAGIKDRETPTPMLKDRLDTGIKLYKEGVAPKLLLTGDNGTEHHNEIHVMLKYAVENGVPEKDIFCDHAGFSTYDSMYRAKDIFQVKKAIIVTQSYHEYRSIYIGEKLGMKTRGVSSDQEKYSEQYVREIREIAARIKDFFKCIKKPESLVGGEKIPITGDGIVSHGE